MPEEKPYKDYGSIRETPGGHIFAMRNGEVQAVALNEHRLKEKEEDALAALAARLNATIQDRG